MLLFALLSVSDNILKETDVPLRWSEDLVSLYEIFCEGGRLMCEHNLYEIFLTRLELTKITRSF